MAESRHSAGIRGGNSEIAMRLAVLVTLSLFTLNIVAVQVEVTAEDRAEILWLVTVVAQGEVIEFEILDNPPPESPPSPPLADLSLDDLLELVRQPPDVKVHVRLMDTGEIMIVGLIKRGESWRVYCTIPAGDDVLPPELVRCRR